MSDFNDSVDGLDDAEAIARDWKVEGNGTTALAGLKTGCPEWWSQKFHQKKRLAHEADFLKQHTPGDIKMTLPTANQFPAIAYKNGISDRAYPTRSEFLWDIVPIIKSEIRALVDEGVKYIQIDAPRYSYYIDPKWRQYVRDEMGLTPTRRWTRRFARTTRVWPALEARGNGFAIHLCRGNNRSQWYAEGGYDPIAEKLFNQLNVDAFFLEYESERAGTFDPLRFVPPGKIVVLGLVSTKLAEIETPDQLVRRIEEASRYVPMDNLALSPQCGFASNGGQLAHRRTAVEQARIGGRNRPQGLGGLLTPRPGRRPRLQCVIRLWEESLKVRVAYHTPTGIAEPDHSEAAGIIPPKLTRQSSSTASKATPWQRRLPFPGFHFALDI